MARDIKDVMTMELPGVSRRRGRPATGKAKTGAQRQRAFRNRHAVVGVGDLIPSTIKRLSEQFEMPVSVVTRELLRFALCNRNWSQLGFPSRVTEKEAETAGPQRSEDRPDSASGIQAATCVHTPARTRLGKPIRILLSGSPETNE